MLPTKALGRYDIDSAPGIYKALNDYYLNGMPCDQADKIVSSSEESIVWNTGGCLQEQNWKRAGADAATMRRLYLSWLTAFVEGINPAFIFTQEGDSPAIENAREQRKIYKK